MANHPILVPVDFSSCSTAALTLAATLADCMQAPLLVLHVVHDPGSMPGYYAKLRKKKQLHHMQDLASEMLEEFLDTVIKQNPNLRTLRKAERIRVTGLPVKRILEVADKYDARMIIMGSRGRTGISKLLIGSTAIQVVQLASIPVMVAKGSKLCEI